jgi:hypothetical protein
MRRRGRPRHVTPVDRHAGEVTAPRRLGHRSSSEETPSSPAFRILMQLSFRSRLAIWRFLCCVVCTARRFSAVVLFRLKIISSGRGALAGTRWAHFNYNSKKV